MVVAEIFVSEIWFLIAIGIIWIVGAVVQDFRKLEVANWWSFSLIVIALAYRAFLSVESSNGWWFGWGVIGLIGGFVLANALYYGRVFAGGDAKLMIALGAILPFSEDLIQSTILHRIPAEIFCYNN